MKYHFKWDSIEWRRVNPIEALQVQDVKWNSRVRYYDSIDSCIVQLSIQANSSSTESRQYWSFQNISPLRLEKWRSCVTGTIFLKYAKLFIVWVRKVDRLAFPDNDLSRQVLCFYCGFDIRPRDDNVVIVRRDVLCAKLSIQLFHMGWILSWNRFVEIVCLSVQNVWP